MPSPSLSLPPLIMTSMPSKCTLPSSHTFWMLNQSSIASHLLWRISYRPGAQPPLLLQSPESQTPAIRSPKPLISGSTRTCNLIAPLISWALTTRRTGSLAWVLQKNLRIRKTPLFSNWTHSLRPNWNYSKSSATSPRSVSWSNSIRRRVCINIRRCTRLVAVKKRKNNKNRRSCTRQSLPARRRRCFCAKATRFLKDLATQSPRTCCLSHSAAKSRRNWCNWSPEFSAWRVLTPKSESRTWKTRETTPNKNSPLLTAKPSENPNL